MSEIPVESAKPFLFQTKTAKEHATFTARCCGAPGLEKYPLHKWEDYPFCREIDRKFALDRRIEAVRHEIGARLFQDKPIRMLNRIYDGVQDLCVNAEERNILREDFNALIKEYNSGYERYLFIHNQTLALIEEWHPIFLLTEDGMQSVVSQLSNPDTPLGRAFLHQQIITFRGCYMHFLEVTRKFPMQTTKPSLQETNAMELKNEHPVEDKNESAQSMPLQNPCLEYYAIPFKPLAPDHGYHRNIQLQPPYLKR